MNKPQKRDLNSKLEEINYRNEYHNDLIDEFNVYFKFLLSKMPDEAKIKNCGEPKYASAYYQGKFDILMNLIGGDK